MVSQVASMVKNKTKQNKQKKKKKQNLPANEGDIRDVGSIPGSGRSRGGGHSNTLPPLFFPRKSHG